MRICQHVITSAIPLMMIIKKNCSSNKNGWAVLQEQCFVSLVYLQPLLDKTYMYKYTQLFLVMHMQNRKFFSKLWNQWKQNRRWLLAQHDSVAGQSHHFYDNLNTIIYVSKNVIKKGIYWYILRNIETTYLTKTLKPLQKFWNQMIFW